MRGSHCCEFKNIIAEKHLYYPLEHEPQTTVALASAVWATHRTVRWICPRRAKGRDTPHMQGAKAKTRKQTTPRDTRTNTLYVEHGPGVCVLQVCNSRNRMVRYISSHLDAHLGGVPQAMEQAALREARLGTRPTERLSKG